MEEPWEIIYFKLYRSQIPVVEQALETAALMLGSDKSRGYGLEMICGDFLAVCGLHVPVQAWRAWRRLISFFPSDDIGDGHPASAPAPRLYADINPSIAPFLLC